MPREQEYRVVANIYWSGKKAYFVDHRPAPGWPWERLTDAFGGPQLFRSRRSARRFIARLQGDRVVRSEVVWP